MNSLLYKVLFYFRYFEEEDETLEDVYQPAPGSPGPKNKPQSDSDEDPLDAYMAGIEKEVLFIDIFLFVEIIIISLFYKLFIHMYFDNISLDLKFNEIE